MGLHVRTDRYSFSMEILLEPYFLSTLLLKKTSGSAEPINLSHRSLLKVKFRALIVIADLRVRVPVPDIDYVVLLAKISLRQYFACSLYQGRIPFA
jgi:hypothetical protein